LKPQEMDCDKFSLSSRQPSRTKTNRSIRRHIQRISSSIHTLTRLVRAIHTQTQAATNERTNDFYTDPFELKLSEHGGEPRPFN